MMIARRISIAVVLGLLLVVLAANESFAVKYRYRYTDEKGEALFVDDLQSVPEKYRRKAMLVSTEEVDEKAQQAAEQERVTSAAAVDAVIQDRAQQQAVAQVQAVKEKRLHIAWTAGIVCSLIAALVILPRIEALHTHIKAVEGARSAIAFLLLAFLLVAFGKDVLRLFEDAGETIAGMERRSADRGRKAAQFYKEMERLTEQAEAVQKEQESQIKALEEHL